MAGEIVQFDKHLAEAILRTVPRLGRKVWGPHAEPDLRRALVQLLNTGVPFLLSTMTICYGLSKGVWGALLLAPLSAGLMVRLFIIQHDCGHHSFFRSRRAND